MKTEKEKMVDSELYFPADQELVKDREGARRLVRSFNGTDETDYEKRTELLKNYSVQLENVSILNPTFDVTMDTTFM